MYLTRFGELPKSRNSKNGKAHDTEWIAIAPKAPLEFGCSSTFLNIKRDLVNTKSYILLQYQYHLVVKKGRIKGEDGGESQVFWKITKLWNSAGSSIELLDPWSCSSLLGARKNHFFNTRARSILELHAWKCSTSNFYIVFDSPQSEL